LISAEQAEAIAAHEGARKQSAQAGRATRAIALLGGLTVVSGVGSLVAYNWARFGSEVKLAAMGLLLFASVFFSLRLRQRMTMAVSAALDVSLLVTTGLTLAGIALVSQVYNQDGELWTLLFAWTALTAPAMSFSRTRFAHYFWYAALFVSFMSSGDAFDEVLRDGWGLAHDHAEFGVMIIYGTMSALLAGRWMGSPIVGRAAVGLAFYRVHLAGVGLFGGLFWLDGGDGAPLLWLLGLVSAAVVVVSTPQAVQRLGYGSRGAAVSLFGAGIMMTVVPMGLPIESGFMAFVSFLLFWSGAWLLAEKSDNLRGARFSVAVIGLRIVIASFELFESLLITGSVLVALGGAALFWSRLRWSTAAEGGAHE
jgi:hypothetical protein